MVRAKGVARNEWPLARVGKIYKGKDRRVLKLDLDATKDGVECTYVRPVTEVALLKSAKELE